ncbi:NAD(P)H-dependent oxidoreductase [Paracoccus onubensis]|uniref:FMN-dependent NADH-azoreductase n=1 Tax=Paracoccus onubensis TaxID=1675788 RepID=UPI00272FC8AD|nr:NAD(P)H-dependent oxidoreductase [Paracoccus onubensis]MDP0930100.1 NAD(P)H-dependent oxidoreductase [Paracoccus onubensis]
MSNLLVIEVSPRGPYSVSRNLAKRFTEKWQSSHGGDVAVRDLSTTDVPYISLPWIGGAFTPPEQHSPEMVEAIRVSDELIAELKATDEILIATPMYNFSIPAVLKSWVDHVLRVGVTFSPSYEGLVTGKKVTVIIATGGDFSPGAPFESANVASAYLRQVLGLIGITDLNIILAGPTLTVDQGQTTIDDFSERFEPALEAAAS